jgi:hypothetical protein
LARQPSFYCSRFFARFSPLREVPARSHVDEYECKNLRFRTVPTIGIWSQIAGQDLRELEHWQSQGGEIYHTVNGGLSGPRGDAGPGVPLRISSFCDTNHLPV